MNNERIRENLEVLIDAIEKEPEEKIDLSNWSLSCGTIHCAAGLAATKHL